VAPTVIGLTLVTVVTSIVVHGVSIPPLMNRYRHRKGGARAATGQDGRHRRRKRAA
jgi:NhaP-type Na+/H+ or K+/H+ antiporter